MKADNLTPDELRHYAILGEVEGITPSVARVVFRQAERMEDALDECQYTDKQVETIINERDDAEEKNRSLEKEIDQLRKVRLRQAQRVAEILRDECRPKITKEVERVLSETS